MGAMTAGELGNRVSTWTVVRRRIKATCIGILAAAFLAGTASAISACAPDTAVVPSTVGTSIPAPVSTVGPTGNPRTPAPVPLQQATFETPVVFDSGVAIRIDSVTAGRVEAKTPGEVSGAVAIVRVTAENKSSTKQDIGSAVATMTADDGTYAVPTFSAPFAPFAGAIAPGERQEGVYVFLLDPASERQVEVTINYSAGAPLAVFTGTVSAEGANK